MTFIYVMIGCILLIASSLLLRKAARIHVLLCLITLVIAVVCFIRVYGNIAGVFVALATALLIGLLTALFLGKSTHKH